MELSCGKKECDEDCPDMMVMMANEVLMNGELIVYPTETLYGLGGDALARGMIDKVKRVKGLPEGQKISTAYSNLEHAEKFIDLPPSARTLGEEFLPGPLTIVVEGEDDTHGIRVPDHPLALKIIDDFGPITSTSANRHGMADPIDMDTAKTQLRNDVKLYLDCGECEYKQGSTVVKVTDEVEILREGVIPEEKIYSTVEG